MMYDNRLMKIVDIKKMSKPSLVMKIMRDSTQVQKNKMQFKILKKIVGILGFKLIDKNLVKNNQLLSNNLLYSIEDILEKLFENKKINQLIQIGANDGKRFDTISANIMDVYIFHK